MLRKTKQAIIQTLKLLCSVGVGHSLWVLLDVFSALLMISKLKTINDTHSPMETSLMISAAVCVPCTRARVHDDRSQWVSTRKMWDSMPRPVPVRVANTRSEPWAGELRALPEWTSLGRHDDTGKENVIEGRKTEEGSFYFPITQTTYLMILQLIPVLYTSSSGQHVETTISVMLQEHAKIFSLSPNMSGLCLSV